MTTLSVFQDAVGDALFADTHAFGREFEVYRHTVWRGCIDALAANFPSAACLVGTTWFRAAAAAFAERRLPTDARMARYGEGFPEFLDRMDEASGLPYLGDVARLDRAWSESHDAADAVALDATHLVAAFTGGLAWRVHPAAAWLRSLHPVVSIWRPSRDGVAPGELGWHPEAALVTRPGMSVTVTAVDPATLVFLDACAAGATLDDAAARTARTHPDAPLDSLIASAIRAGALALA